MDAVRNLQCVVHQAKSPLSLHVRSFSCLTAGVSAGEVCWSPGMPTRLLWPIRSRLLS